MLLKTNKTQYTYYTPFYRMSLLRATLNKDNIMYKWISVSLMHFQNPKNNKMRFITNYLKRWVMGVND